MSDRPKVDFFYQIDCPYCDAIKHYVLLDILDKIRLNEIDVEYSKSEKVERWREVCRSKWGKGVTPLARVGKYWIPVWKGGDKETTAEGFKRRLNEAIQKHMKSRNRPDYPEVAITENLEERTSLPKKADTWIEQFKPAPGFREFDKLGDMVGK